MTNAEKFEEVFGFKPNKNLCYAPEDVECPQDCDDCSYISWLNDEYVEPKQGEQEPCEDAISRAEAVRVASGYCHPSNIAKELAKLPPVTPKQKMGRWITEINDYGEVMGWHCDKCYEDSGFTMTCKWDFCPNCGAKMILSHRKARDKE